jgi:hypothetical protein
VSCGVHVRVSQPRRKVAPVAAGAGAGAVRNSDRRHGAAGRLELPDGLGRRMAGVGRRSPVPGPMQLHLFCWEQVYAWTPDSHRRARTSSEPMAIRLPEPCVFVMAGGGLISLVSVISYFLLLLFLAPGFSASSSGWGALIPFHL